MFRKFFGLSVIGLALCLTGCGRPYMIDLAYMPKSTPMAFPMPPMTVAVSVQDSRQRVIPYAKDPKMDGIGQNIENSDKPRAIATYDSPPAFVGDVAGRLLKLRNVKVVSDPAQAQRRLVLHLQSFWTVEGDTYKAQVDLKGDLMSQDGRSLWQGSSSGSGSNWGSSLKEVNYQEVLTDATMDSLQQLMKDPAFVAAMR